MFFLQSCPWALVNSDAVSEVASAAKWFDKNQLETKYPNPPASLLEAVEAYDNGYNRGQHDRFERERKEREAKSKAK
jgi:hypothetical protein